MIRSQKQHQLKGSGKDLNFREKTCKLLLWQSKAPGETPPSVVLGNQNENARKAGTTHHSGFKSKPGSGCSYKKKEKD